AVGLDRDAEGCQRTPEPDARADAEQQRAGSVVLAAAVGGALLAGDDSCFELTCAQQIGAEQIGVKPTSPLGLEPL
ncbi:MAG: hypothetical protein ACTHMZ_04305, partial [Actinomycetes bacterium]